MAILIYHSSCVSRTKKQFFLLRCFSSLCFIRTGTDLDDGGKVLSVDLVLRLHVQVTQLAGSHGVVLGVELVKTLEGLSALQRNSRETGKEIQIEEGRQC